jgi:hypothetical protein
MCLLCVLWLGVAGSHWVHSNTTTCSDTRKHRHRRGHGRSALGKSDLQTHQRLAAYLRFLECARDKFHCQHATAATALSRTGAPGTVVTTSTRFVLVHYGHLHRIHGAVYHRRAGFLPFLLTGSPYGDPLSVLFQMSILFGPALIQLRVAKSKITRAHNYTGPSLSSGRYRTMSWAVAPGYPETPAIETKSTVLASDRDVASFRPNTIYASWSLPGIFATSLMNTRGQKYHDIQECVLTCVMPFYQYASSVAGA